MEVSRAAAFLLLSVLHDSAQLISRCDLTRLLNNDPEDVSQYLRWDSTGRLLIIPDEKDLVEKVCKVHFAQKNITSFVSSFQLSARCDFRSLHMI